MTENLPPEVLDPEGKVYSDPSYAVITLGRNTNSSPGPMFGSVVRSGTTMRLSITPASLRHSYGADQIWPSGAPAIIEVQMTEEQFGRLLSTVGIGEGVPCTIKRRDGKILPDPPQLDTEQKRIHDHFTVFVRSLAKDLRGHIPKIEAILQKEGGLGKADRELIRREISQIHTEIASNMDFILQTFQESAERVVEASKVEIAAYAQRVTAAQGLPAGTIKPTINLEA